MRSHAVTVGMQICLAVALVSAPLNGATLARTATAERVPPAASTAPSKAVLDGLRWLIRHQNPDGSWSSAALSERCTPDKPCSEASFKPTDHYDDGLTAMALLCFLRAGFSDESTQVLVDTTTDKRHKVGEVVKNGLQWLAKKQKADGSFANERAFMYNEALCALALAEAYGRSKNVAWKEPAQKSIEFLQKAQKPNPSGKGLWGWRYASRVEIEDTARGKEPDGTYREELHDADTSITGWAITALDAARNARLSVSKDALDGGMSFCKWVTPSDGSGLVGYLDPAAAGANLTGPNDAGFVYHPTGLAAIAMCIRILVQDDRKDPFLEQAAQRIVRDLPARLSPVGSPSSVDYYYWYYASHALSAFDGPDSPKKNGKYWKPWKEAVLDSVLALQDHSESVCSNGGWIAGDRWSYAGGPIYCTAINVLTLETAME